MTPLPHVAILTAAYNDWPSLAAMLPLIDQALAGQVASVRVVVIDDGSSIPLPDDLLAGQSYGVINQVDLVALTRNLGNQRALSIGIGWLAASIDADFVVVMDCDHEDRPEVVPALIAAAQAEGGGKIVFASRTQRQDGFLFKAFYAIYKRLYQLSTGMPISIGNFSAIPRRLVRRLAGVWEIGIHFPAGVMKARLPFTSIGAARGRRLFGTSHMNMVNLMIHGFSGLAVHAEAVAVRVVLWTMGLGAAILAYIGYAFFQKFIAHSPPSGWMSVMMALFIGILFQAAISGLLLLFLVLTARFQRPVIPLKDHQAFVLEVITLYPPSQESQDAR